MFRFFGAPVGQFFDFSPFRCHPGTGGSAYPTALSLPPSAITVKSELTGACLLRKLRQGYIGQPCKSHLQQAGSGCRNP